MSGVLFRWLLSVRRCDCLFQAFSIHEVILLGVSNGQNWLGQPQIVAILSYKIYFMLAKISKISKSTPLFFCLRTSNSDCEGNMYRKSSLHQWGLSCIPKMIMYRTGINGIDGDQSHSRLRATLCVWAWTGTSCTHVKYTRNATSILIRMQYIASDSWNISNDVNATTAQWNAYHIEEESAPPVVPDSPRWTYWTSIWPLLDRPTAPLNGGAPVSTILARTRQGLASGTARQRWVRHPVVWRELSWQGRVITSIASMICTTLSLCVEWFVLAKSIEQQTSHLYVNFD